MYILIIEIYFLKYLYTFSITEDQFAAITDKFGVPKGLPERGPPRGFQTLMDMHPQMKNQKPDTVIKRAADRLSRPKNTDVKPVKKKNPLADLLDADDGPLSSGYNTFDSSAVATAADGRNNESPMEFLKISLVQRR